MSEAIQPRMIDFKPHEIPLEDLTSASANCGLKI